jgi:hypothetical protein
MYTREDCIGVVQLTAWQESKPVRDVTTTEYKDSGFAPSLPVFFDLFEDWDGVKEAASTSEIIVPSHVDLYHQAIASLRKAVAETGYPLTGLEYQDMETELPVSYVEVINTVGPWTEAKRTAEIHTQPIAIEQLTRNE